MEPLIREYSESETKSDIIYSNKNLCSGALLEFPVSVFVYLTMIDRK